MAVEKLEIVERSAYRESEQFGETGAYERIDAIAHYAVDPENPANAGIVDIGNVARDGDGLVRYDGDVTILRPTDPDRSQRVGLVEVPNRGRRTAGTLYNLAGALMAPSVEIEPGDGLLFRSGWTMAWCGWQWDVPRSRARMGLTAPNLIGADGQPEPAEVQLRLQLHEAVTSIDLTDHHVGVLGGHDPLPTHDLADSTARLLVRSHLWSDATEIPRERWGFGQIAAGDDGSPTPDDSHIWLEGGFESGLIYDLIYRTLPVRVAGAGLLAVRDLGAFLRSAADDNPAAGLLDHLIATGQSQCGRFLRHFLHLGLNQDENGSMVYDGVLSHIAGGRRGEFNHRGAQPSVQPTPTFGHRFPFADDAQTDARTGETAGLLDTQRSIGSVPKIVYTNTSSEYWRGDASLAHTKSDDGSDVEPPAETRHYLFSSTQHGPGALPLSDHSPLGSSGGNSFNIVDYRPLIRAVLFNLRDWVVDGIEPPSSAVPRSDDGTAVSRSAVLESVSAIDRLAAPTNAGLSTLRALDLGPEAAGGVGTFPATPTSDDYPCLVSAVNADGNEVAGIPMPDVTVPVATHTGWNPRHARTGAPDQILEYLGSTLPFASKDPALDNPTPGTAADPRPALATRYRDKAHYLELIEAAARELLERRLILADDVSTCIDVASERYDAFNV